MIHVIPVFALEFPFFSKFSFRDRGVKCSKKEILKNGFVIGAFFIVCIFQDIFNLPIVEKFRIDQFLFLHKPNKDNSGNETDECNVSPIELLFRIIRKFHLFQCPKIPIGYFVVKFARYFFYAECFDNFVERRKIGFAHLLDKGFVSLSLANVIGVSLKITPFSSARRQGYVVNQ